MSFQRYATDGNSAKHQRRFFADEYQRGLDALIVSQRCACLEELDELPLIWMLQQRSWQTGGLRQVAVELLGMFRAHVDFAAMAFVNTDPVGWLTSHLESACLRPNYALALPESRDWKGDFLDDLRAYRERAIARVAGRLFETEVAETVFTALDYALESPGSMTLCYGQAGIGKSEAARQWCEMRPDAARYIEVPAVQNERGFYSAIAEELGIPRGTSYNGQQTNLRIIDVLKESRLMLVLDESQRLWPQKNRPTGTPMRVLWLTSLVNAGVLVGLIAMPDFFKWKQLLVKYSNWTDAQFNRRLSMIKELPAQLGEDDLRGVARHLMPAGCSTCHELLVSYAQASKHNLSAIAETLRMARFLAKKAGRSEAGVVDVRAAIRDERAPMDCILAADPAALAASDDFPQVATKRRRGAIAAVPRGTREPLAPMDAEEGEPTENEALPRQVHGRAVAPSPAAR